jgi:hypothetical protein
MIRYKLVSEQLLPSRFSRKPQLEQRIKIWGRIRKVQYQRGEPAQQEYGEITAFAS